MKRSKFNTFTMWGGVLQGKEASVRFVSDKTSERRSEVGLIGGDSL